MKEEVLSLARNDEIHSKGFNMYSTHPSNSGANTDYSRIKVGPKILEDAAFDVGALTRLNGRLAEKESVQRAIETGNLNEMIDISNYFVKLSGIYRRLCKHMSNLYRYDWVLTPYVKKMSNEKVIEAFHKQLEYLDSF